jgi:tetratricopeptide (TPR) repeat protein
MLMGGVLHQLMREPEEVLKYANEGIAIADEHQIVQERAWIATNRGWAQAMLGNIDEGLAEIETSLAMRKRMNADLDLPYALTQLAEAYSTKGDLDRARTTLHDALEAANRNSDLWAQSEVYRMLGDLALQRVPPSDNALAVDIEDEAEVRRNAAEGFYYRALDVAREQGARLYELRAAVSIGKIMERDNRAAEALELVEPLRAQLDGQRSTPDSVDADMLLSRLRSAAQG